VDILDAGKVNDMKIPPFRLERFFARYELKAPYLLSSSDCESLSIQELLDLEPGSAERFRGHWLGYTESQGSPELRRQITCLYDQIAPDDVLVHAGAEEAIFVFANATLEPGDHVIVHTPCYQSLAEIARSIGCDVTAWQTRPQDGWELDTDFLKQAVRPGTRAIVVNCPHNPTGYLMNHTKLSQILDIAREHGILVFSDEVYRGLEHDPAERLPATCDLYENAVSLGVMSKTYGLAGLRIGWIATRNREVYAKMAGFKDYTSICNSAPGEFLAAVALRHRDRIVRRNLDIIRRNLDVLDGFFARHRGLFDWQRPRAGSVAFPGIATAAEAFCIDLVERQGVLLLPSTCFDAGNRHFRIGFGRKNLPDAVEKLHEYIQQYVVQKGSS
jgi:aspartate/methionine/tyrosine aminotransferase